MSTTATRTEQVEARNVEQADLVQFGGSCREVLEVERVDYQLRGVLIKLTVSTRAGSETFEVPPRLTLTRTAI